MIRAAFLFALLAAQPVMAETGAVLRGLDRLNGTIEDFEIAPGQELTFGRLKISLVDCRTPRNSNEAHAYLKVADVRQPDQNIFDGWMFAASPAYAAVDHPRYDVWVLSCKTSS